MPKPKRKPTRFEGLSPTPEQLPAFSETWQVADGKRARAYRRIAVIDDMHAKGKLSTRQFAGLARFRDLATAQDASPRRDSLDAALHGHGGGSIGLPPGMALMRLGGDWESELAWLERELGSLLHIARAIAVDDMTVSQWAITRHGSKERRRGKVICIEPHTIAAKHAMVDIRMAGERLSAALDI